MPDIDSRHTAGAESRRWRRPGGGRSAGTRTHPASDTQPSTSRRPLRSRIAVEIQSNSSETSAAARRYTTDSGVLKQPDKQEPDFWPAGDMVDKLVRGHR